MLSLKSLPAEFDATSSGARMAASALRLAVGAAFALAGWGLHWVIIGLFGGDGTYMPFFPALVSAAVLFGVAPGIACTLVSAAIVWLVIRDGTQAPVRGGELALATFIASGIFISIVGGMARGVRRQSAAMRASDAQYRMLFDAIDEGFGIIQMLDDDRDYLFLEANGAFFRHTGLPADAVGRRVREIIPDLDGSWFRMYGEVARTGRPRRFEKEAPQMGRWFDVYAFRIGEPGERKVGLLFTDISQRKRTEDALRLSDERLARALAAGDLGAWDLDLDTRRAWRSPQHDRIFGYTSPLPEWTYEMFLEHVVPEHRAEVDREFKRAIASGEDLIFECRIRRTDGQIRWIWGQGRLESDNSGGSRRIHGMVRDISAAKAAAEALSQRAAALEQANADLLQFASAASHDLKEPLRGIARLARFIRDDEPAIGEESRRRLERIGDLCERLTRMVGGLIAHARTGLHPRLEQCDLNEMIRRVVDSTREQLNEKRAVVEVLTPLPTIRADCALMERLYANLIANGVKFNESEVKRVEIFWVSAPRSAVAVRDNGIGIEERHREKLFGLFKRLHPPERYPGEGLGLALARRIVEAHGGRIDVESTGIEGQGTTFYIHLPHVLSQGGDNPTAAEVSGCLTKA